MAGERRIDKDKEVKYNKTGMLYGCGVLSLHVRRNAGLSFFSKLLKVISYKKYQKNPLGKKLSPLQQSVLNIGVL